MLWMWALSCHVRVKLTATFMLSISVSLFSSAVRMAWGFFCNTQRKILVLVPSFFKARCFQSFLTPFIHIHTSKTLAALPGTTHQRPFTVLFLWDLPFKTSHSYATQLTHELNSACFHTSEFSLPCHQPPREPGSNGLTCRSLAMDSLGMSSLRLSRVMKQSAWYWLCPLSSSPRISARKIFTSWEEKHVVIFQLCHSLRNTLVVKIELK